MQGPAPIPVFRPSKLTPGPEFQGSRWRPANIFYQQIKASRATLDRIQFQWRSVSDNLLISPIVRVRFKLKVGCPKIWTHLTSTIPLAGLARLKDQDGLATFAAIDGHANAAAAAVIGSAPCLVFADGDAFTNCCSSINLQFNGTSLSLHRTNRFWRDYQRTQLSSDDSARIYKCSGGAYDKYDQTACVVHTGGGGAREGALATLAAGITMDSGVAERSKTLYSSAVDEVASGTIAFKRTIWVSYPVPVAPLNPWHGYVLPASCPYKNCPLAIPHLSAGGLDFLMEDFAAGFIRRLSGAVAATDALANANGMLAGKIEAAVTVEMGETKDCILELKYFRLSHTRSLKESYRFNVWQTQTFLGPDPPKERGSGHIRIGATASTAKFYAMEPVGKDVISPSAATKVTFSCVSASSAKKTWDLQFDSLNLAQVPSFLLISVPRLGSQYTLLEDSAAAKKLGENCVRNLSRNLSIKKLKIVVNSAPGAIDEDGSDQTGFVNAERLFELTQENAGSHYFKEGGFRAWRDEGMAILLSSAQFAPGLQVSDGVSYPINVDVEFTVENRHVQVSALSVQASRAHKAEGDYIRAQGQVTAIFTKIVLATTETSASTNAMNYPLDSAERLLNAAGQMR